MRNTAALTRNSMRQRLTLIAIALLTFLFSLVFSGCRHDPLCYDHSHIVRLRIEYDWQNAPDAEPQLMLQYFFPGSRADDLTRFIVNNRFGCTVSIDAGVYNALCVSESDNNIRVRNDGHFDDFYVTSSDANYIEGLSNFGIKPGKLPISRAEDSDRVINAPDEVYIDRVIGFEMLRGVENQVLTHYPESPLHHYSLKVLHADNLEHALSFTGSLTAMAEGVYVGTGDQYSSTATLFFPLHKVGKEDLAVDGHWLTFGHEPRGVPHNMHILIIYVVMETGEKYYYEFDVTDQLNNAPDQKNIEIVIDELPLPKPVENVEGGFHPEVGEWMQEYVDIIL